MNEKFKQAYHELSLSDKRNELNNEMELAYEMLLALKKHIGLEPNLDEKLINYDIIKDETMSESDLLDLLYYDFFIIEKNIIDIATKLSKKNN